MSPFWLRRWEKNGKRNGLLRSNKINQHGSPPLVRTFSPTIQGNSEHNMSTKLQPGRDPWPPAAPLSPWKIPPSLHSLDKAMVMSGGELWWRRPKQVEKPQN